MYQIFFPSPESDPSLSTKTDRINLAINLASTHKKYSKGAEVAALHKAQSSIVPGPNRRGVSHV